MSWYMFACSMNEAIFLLCIVTMCTHGKKRSVWSVNNGWLCAYQVWLQYGSLKNRKYIRVLG